MGRFRVSWQQCRNIRPYIFDYYFLPRQFHSHRLWRQPGSRPIAETSVYPGWKLFSHRRCLHLAKTGVEYYRGCGWSEVDGMHGESSSSIRGTSWKLALLSARIRLFRNCVIHFSFERIKWQRASADGRIGSDSLMYLLLAYAFFFPREWDCSCLLSKWRKVWSVEISWQ